MLYIFAAELVESGHIRRFRQSSFVKAIEKRATDVYAKHTIEYLKKMETQFNEDFSNVRNLITIDILIDNGHRAGVILNMSMDEYDNRVGNVIKVGNF